MPPNRLFTVSSRVRLPVLTPQSVLEVLLSRRFTAMTEGVTSAADAVDELISPVSCLNGAGNVNVSNMFSNAIEMAAAV